MDLGGGDQLGVNAGTFIENASGQPDSQPSAARQCLPGPRLLFFNPDNTVCRYL
jgi:hypothetical protein